MGLTDIVKRALGKPEAVRPENIGRNDRCWCGSGRKYKACHLAADEDSKAAERAAACWTGGG
jgi:hypothetical protein